MSKGARESDFVETTVDGPSTVQWMLTSDDCPALAKHRIRRIGLTDAAVPYERVRTQPTGSFVMVAHSGRGRILLDGRWQTSEAGVACLSPPRVLNAFQAVAGSRWTFAWIRYEEPEHVQPLVSASSPVRVMCDAEVLWRIISGLQAEWLGGKSRRLIDHWIELAHGEAERIAQPWHVDDRLWVLWDHVAEDLAADWTLDELAAHYKSSKEKLRRVCLRALGRSPMQHLMSLRIERACELLEASTDKIEDIARKVGFDNASVFSRSFKRWVGRSPKAFRGQGDAT